MSAKDLISPYLNRFVAINQQKSFAKLELICSNGKVSVNFFHDLGVIEEETPKHDQDQPAYSDVLRKNVHLSQSARLKRRAETRAEEARAETKRQQHIAENAKIEAVKATTQAEKATIEAEKAATEADEAKRSAEEAKVLSFKIKKDSEETIARCEFVIQNAQRDVNNLREEAEKAKLLLAKEVEKAGKDREQVNFHVNKPLNLTANSENIEEEFECEYCPEEFTNKKRMRST